MDLFTLDRFDRPWCLWLALLCVLAWWMTRRSLAGLGAFRGRLSIAMRCLVILLLVLVLAGTHRILKSDEMTVQFVLDESRSIPDTVRRQAEAYLQSLGRAIPAKEKENTRIGILSFDGQTNIEQLPARPGPETGIFTPMPLADGGRPDQTNLAQALRVAVACAPQSTANRIVLMSDGNQNAGDVLEEAKAARANGITIDVIPLKFERGTEVVFERLKAPPYAHLEELIPLRLLLRAERKTTGTIFIYQRVGASETPVIVNKDTGQSGERVTLESGPNVFNIKVPIKVNASHEFRAEFVPDDKNSDAIVANNVARAFTNVEGPARVLYIGTDADRADDELLVDALKKENIQVEFESTSSVSLEPSTLQDYSAVILSNTPADDFSAEQQQALVNYVRDIGGGLIMTGGDQGFGAGGWQGSPVEDIMPVRFDVDAVRQIPRGALAIVMHSCEMPNGNKWGIDTAVAALKTLSSLDYYGVVGWGMAGFHWEVPMQIAANKEAISQKILKMQNADMFDFETPMKMAFQALMNVKDAAQRHMIIISDGDPAAPSAQLIKQMVAAKVTCSTVMIFPHGGMEMATMKKIANDTKGRYYMLNKAGDEKQLPKIFTKEAKIVRRPIIRDEIFTPRIKPYLSDVMAGVGDNLPQLAGYVVTTPRKNVEVEMPLVTKKGDPLLAHWLCGFGRTLAFTSGRWRHWGADWAGWSGYSKLWAQAVRWCMRQGTAEDYDKTLTIEGDRGHVIIEARSDAEGFANFRPFKSRVVKPNGEAVDLNIVQTGPGKYEAWFDAKEMGTYLVTAQAPGKENGQPVNIRMGTTVAYSPEYKELGVNEALLAEVAKVADGRVLSLDSDANTVFARTLPPAVARKPIWDRLLQIAVLLFLLDVAVRRIAFDPVKMAKYARTQLAHFAGRFTGGAAEKTLTDLKGIRAKVREERTAAGDAEAARRAGRDRAAAGGGAAGGAAGASTTAGATDAGPSAGAKFDAGGKKPTGSLVDSLGGAKPGEPGAKPPGKKDDAPSESMTTRLLKAKKKARDNIEKPEEPPQ